LDEEAAVASLVGAGTNRTPIAAGRSTALVPDASSYLWEEQRRRAALDERFGRSPENAELDEPFRDHQRCRAVNVVPFRSGTAGGDRGLPGAPDCVVDQRLLRGEKQRLHDDPAMAGS
jgi:hypothetical protein